MPDTPSPCRKLALDIQAIFQKGLCIGMKTQHFILSTLPVSNLNELQPFLTDCTNSEYDFLAELIYFPDESIQIRLESRIESGKFRKEDQAAILRHIMDGQGKTRIQFQGQPTLLTIDTLPSGAAAFLSRLNIDRHLEPDLIRTILECAGTPGGAKYKVWLRNMTLALRERDTAFIKNLFLKMGPRHKKFDDILRFSLRFLEEASDEIDITESLRQYKHRCLHHIQRSERLEANPIKENFDIRMALGIRRPYTDKADLISKVALIDEISLALFDGTM